MKVRPAEQRGTVSPDEETKKLSQRGQGAKDHPDDSWRAVSCNIPLPHRKGEIKMTATDFRRIALSLPEAVEGSHSGPRRRQGWGKNLRHPGLRKGRLRNAAVDPRGTSRDGDRRAAHLFAR